MTAVVQEAPPDISDYIPRVLEVAAKMSRRVAPDFAGYVEWLDLRQDCLLWALEHPHKVVEYLEPTEDDPKRLGGERALAKVFFNISRKTAYSAKADRLGGMVSDNHWYGSQLVIELLPRILDYDLWATGSGTGNTRSAGDPAEGGNQIAMLCDVRRAYDAASDQDKRLLYARYISTPAVDWTVLCDELERSRRTVERQTDNALRRIVRQLGGFRPDFGSE